MFIFSGLPIDQASDRAQIQHGRLIPDALEKITESPRYRSQGDGNLVQREKVSHCIKLIHDIENMFVMPPTSKKLRGHIGLGLSVQSSPVLSNPVQSSLSVMRE